MPIFTDGMETQQLKTSNYGFSAKRISELGATEYTLVVLVYDKSGSVAGFKSLLETCLRATVESCQYSPRADNLMLRMVTFSSDLTEIHGFRPLSECHVGDYDGCIQPGGMTALYDAACNAIESVTTYGKDLSSNDFDVNALVIVVTDGDDNCSTMTAKKVKEQLAAAVQSESLESIRSVLVGVNIQDPNIGRKLSDFQADAGFNQYIEIEKASPSSIAKLGGFISKSISAQSQALGTGGPSQSLSF